MTEHESNDRLESQLHDLYTTPEPTPAFTRQLRARIIEQAGRQRLNWSAKLWKGLTSAGRIAFSLGGAALLVGLALLGANLLAARFEPEQVKSPTLASASTPEATDSAIIFKPPQLDPLACATVITPQPSNAGSNRPGKLLGGGVVKSGDFQINLYLFCDSSFRPESSTTYSEIAGLGIYQSYWYNGPNIDEPATKTTVYHEGQPYTKEIPAVSLQSGTRMSQKTGFFTDPSTIPDWSAPELPMQFRFTIPGERGRTYGALLSFRLINGPDGFTVHDVVVKGFNEAEIAQADQTFGFLPIYPTAAPESLHPLLDELKVLQERQRAWLYTDEGWYLQRMQWEIAGDPYANLPLQDSPSYVFAKSYFNDIWYKVDERGILLGSVNRRFRPDEGYGEMILNEESYILPKPGVQEGSFTKAPVFDEGAFAFGVEAIRQGGSITKQEFTGAVQYTITTGTHATRAVFDSHNGKLLEVSNYTIEKSGEMQLYSTAKTITLERVDEPPPDILNLFEKAPGN